MLVVLSPSLLITRCDPLWTPVLDNIGVT